MKTLFHAFVVLIMGLALFLVGCAGVCNNKDKILNGMNLVQSGYDAYVKAAAAGNLSNTLLDPKEAQTRAYLVLADQVLAMAGPYVQNGILAACPPESVVAAVETKVAQAKAVKPPLASPAAGTDGQQSAPAVAPAN